MAVEDRMATIYDVAQLAGVSISTVSHVLNGTRFVSEETKARVYEAIEQLGYRPSSVARALASQATKTIALIVPDSANPFFVEVARGVEDYGFRAGYSVIICNSGYDVERETAYIEMAISKRVDGVVYMSMNDEADRVQRLVTQRLPVVAFDREFEQVDAVYLENLQGGLGATRHLLELGHRRIACITGPQASCRSYRRTEGYQLAMAEAGLQPDPELVFAGDWSHDSGRRAARHFCELPVPPTAIFACNDTMACGAITCLHERGIAVPADISVVGYDNIIMSAYLWPPLTTWATPIAEIGQGMCELLLKRIAGQLPAEPQRVSVQGRLVVRGTTAAPPARGPAA